MFSKKNLFAVICLGLLSLQLPVFADDISDMKASLNDVIAKLVQRYEARINELETENAVLKQTIASLKGSGALTTSTTTPVVPTKVSSTGSISALTSKSDVYDRVMKHVNANLGAILSDNGLPGYSVFGLFEFIEPNVFFLSLDDGNNPAGVTAFKTKILYAYDNNLNLTKIGMFDLDYTSQKYRTVFGSNPYTTAVRTRVQNPLYKGKLLDATSTTSTGNASTPTASTSVTPTDVTLAQIQTAYDNKKLLDAIKLSDVYIVKNPSDLTVLRIRYRSYYIIGKYDESLAEIKKIETLQGSALEKTIACDAAVIGKIAKKTDISNYYSTICKKK